MSQKEFINNLAELGLTENQAKVYLALLELGQTTTGNIIKRTKLYRVIIYDILEQLLELGLVHYVIKKNIKHFEAENPKQILEILKNKEIVAKETVKRLEKLKVKEQLPKGAMIYEGWKGIKAAQENYFKLMNKEIKSNNKKKGEKETKQKSEYLMVGASKQLHKRLDAFFNYFHERRSKIKIPAKLLFNENNKEYGKLKQKYKPVQIRFMPKKIITPSWISMYEDMILIGTVGEDHQMGICY